MDNFVKIVDNFPILHKKKKKKQKKFNKTKAMKRVARDMFIDIPTSTQVHTDKKKYSRKQKHKKRLDDE